MVDCFADQCEGFIGWWVGHVGVVCGCVCVEVGVGEGVCEGFV